MLFIANHSLNSGLVNSVLFVDVAGHDLIAASNLLENFFV